MTSVPEVVKQHTICTDLAAWIACCRFKEHVLHTEHTLTRSISAHDFEALAKRFPACSDCCRRIEDVLRSCGNPYDELRHTRFKKHLRKVDEALRKKYPLLRHCRFVCEYCINRARRDKKKRRKDKYIIKGVKRKIKSYFKKMGFNEETIKKSLKQINTPSKIHLIKLKTKPVRTHKTSDVPDKGNTLFGCKFFLH